MRVKIIILLLIASFKVHAQTWSIKTTLKTDWSVFGYNGVDTVRDTVSYTIYVVPNRTTPANITKGEVNIGGRIFFKESDGNTYSFPYTESLIEDDCINYYVQGLYGRLRYFPKQKKVIRDGQGWVQIFK